MTDIYHRGAAAESKRQKISDDGSGESLPPEAYRVIADVLGGGKGVFYRPLFAHAFGGACNALLLSQFWFWTNSDTVKERDGDGWFWKSQKGVTAETGMTRTETLTARRKLCAQGVMEEEVRGVPATVHFRVAKDVLFERLWAYIQARPDEFAGFLQTEIAGNLQTGSRETRKPDRRKAANQNPGKPQTITETTTENTEKPHQQQPPTPAPTAEPDPPQEAQDSAVVVAIDLLLKEGVGAKRAEELAREHPLDRIQRQIAWLDQRTIKKSRTGTLIDSIAYDWGDPGVSPPAPGSPQGPAAPQADGNHVRAMPSATLPFAPPSKPAQGDASPDAVLDRALALVPAADLGAVLKAAHGRLRVDERGRPIVDAPTSDGEREDSTKWRPGYKRRVAAVVTAIMAERGQA